MVMEALAREGVDTLFGYPGGVVLPLYDEMLAWPEIKHVLVRHEQGAAHMADGYARATGKVGVCLATSGPGATNLVTGLATAMLDSVPMVAITGQVSRAVLGKDAFQEIDIQGITIPLTKHNYLVTEIEDLPEILAEAFFLARTGRKGPVLVDIPKDVFLASTAASFPIVLGRRGYALPQPPKLHELQEALALLSQAERPVLIAGAGVLYSESWEELREFAERCDLPVANSLLGIGAFPRNHPLSLGMMGMHGEAAATLAVQEADLVIGAGIRFDDRLTGDPNRFAPHAKIVHFDLDPTEIGKTVRADAAVIADLKASLAGMLRLAPAMEHAAWRKRVEAWQKEFPLALPEGPEMLSRHVLHALNEATGGRAIVSTDVGQHQMWAAQFYRPTAPRAFLSSGGLGTMGYGLPAAMGAKFACPDREVWAIVGDGGFQMTLQELQTAVEHRLGVKICLLNNGYLGMVRQWQELFYENRHSHVLLGSPDYAKLAEAYGVSYLRCQRAEDLPATFEAAEGLEGPVLCEFVVAMEENVYPMVPAGGGNSQVIMDPALRAQTVAR